MCEFLGEIAHGYRAVSTRAIADQDHLGEYGDVIPGRELSGVKRDVASREAAQHRGRK